MKEIKNLEGFLQECKVLAQTMEEETPIVRGIDLSKTWELEHYRLAVKYTNNNVRAVKAYVLQEQLKYLGRLE